MALDKGDISGTTNNYVNLLGKVKTACNDAASKVRTCQSNVSDNWKGEAGSAMASALTEVEQEIKALATEIANLQSKVKTRGSTITTNWVDEEA